MKQTSALEIGIPVIDLERMVEFYTEVFSCTEERRAEIPAELSAAIGVHPQGYVNVWLKLPGGEVIKLVNPPSPPASAERPAFAAQRTGIAYFTLYCDDISGAISRARDRGARLESDPELARRAEGVRLAFLTDPEGNLFEFVQV